MKVQREKFKELNTEIWLKQYDGKYAEGAEVAERASGLAEKECGPDHPAAAYFLDWAAKFYLRLSDYSKLTPLLQRAPEATGVRAGEVAGSCAIVERAPVIGGHALLRRWEVLPLKPGDLVGVVCTLEDDGVRTFSERVQVRLRFIDTDAWEGFMTDPSPILHLKGGESVRFHPLAVVGVVGRTDPWGESGEPRIVIWDALLASPFVEDSVEDLLDGILEHLRRWKGKEVGVLQRPHEEFGKRFAQKIAEQEERRRANKHAEGDRV